jgi:hypothetical protein
MPACYIDRSQSPWNKELPSVKRKLFSRRHVWSIRDRLELAQSKRNLAIFNLAIDSKLRADPVKLRLNDICLGSNVQRRMTIVQKENSTARAVRNHGTVQKFGRSLPTIAPTHWLPISFSKSDSF